MRFKSLVGAYDYPSGVEIIFDRRCAYNPEIIWFRWPDGQMLWLEEHEFEMVEE
jgi:hypothetical protein